MNLKAEAILYETEFKALYTSLTNLQTEYNVSLIEFEDTDDVGYKYFNEKIEDGDVTWYIVYGKDRADFDTRIFNYLGVDELKYSYKYRLRNLDNSKDEIFIEYYVKPVQIGDYTVKSYEDMINLMNSGAI